MSTNELGNIYDLNPEKQNILFRLNDNEIVSPDHKFVLMPALPLKKALEYFLKAFSDPMVLQYLAVSSDFSAEEYVQRMSGDINRASFGSINDALFFIYKTSESGPIGHVSIKDIDWNRMSFHRGMVLLSDFHHKGIGSKISFMMLSRMKELGFREALTEVKEGNLISNALVTKQFGEGVHMDDGLIHYKLDLTKPLKFNPYDNI